MMKHVCIALAVLAVTTAALPADEHTLEVDTENMLLQANARVQALLAEGKDDSACRDLAKSEKKIAEDTINTNQNMLNSIPSGKNCHYAGQVAVDAATSTKSAADNSLTLAEKALSSAQNFQIDFGKRSFNSMSGSCAIAKSDNKYVSAKENGDAAKETLLQAQGAAKIAATELRSAREAALKKKQACKCNVQKKQAAGWKEANTNNAAIATGYKDAMKMMCVLDGKRKCTFKPLQSLVRPEVHSGSKEAKCRGEVNHPMWVQETAAAAWPARFLSSSAVLNNKLYVLGGAGPRRRNDVWSSTDGVSWRQETAAAPWSARSYLLSAVLNNKLYVFGGQDLYAKYLNDVWSSTDGASWSKLSAGAPWAARKSSSAVLNNKMYVLGGFGSNHQELNDVWSSTDGASWSQETKAAPWAARREFAVVVSNNKMYVLGGIGSGHVGLTDVWSSTDGASWNQETAAAPWSARYYFSSVAFNNKLYVLGGLVSDTSKRLNDVWSSTDGASWSQETAAASWSARAGLSSAVLNNKLYVLGGRVNNVHNDVWSIAGDGELYSYSDATTS